MAISTQPGLPAVSLLCVDDDPQILTLLKSFLEKEPGFIVETSTSARDALHILETRNFDAILSDYYMPEMDGIALLREIRARGIPALFVIFTGRHIAQIAIDTLNNGGNFYVQKGSGFLEAIPKIVDLVKSRTVKGITDEELSLNIARSCSFAEHQMDLLAIFLPDGTVTFANEAYSTSMGLHDSRIPPAKFFMQIPEPERTEVMTLLTALTPEKPGIYIEHSLTTADNTPRTFQWEYCALFDTGNLTREILAQGRDVSKILRTARTETLSSPAESKVRPVSTGENNRAGFPAGLTGSPELEGFNASVENLPYPVFAIDAAGVVISWNTAIAEATGIKAGEIIGRGNYAYAVPFYGKPRPMLADYILKPKSSDISLPLAISQDRDAFIGKAESITLRGRPMLMGGRATAIRNANGDIIAAVQSILLSEHHRAGTIDDLYEDERYLGGVSSVILKVTGKGLAGAIAGAVGAAPGGYGVYATNQRLFIAHNPVLDAPRDSGVKLGRFVIDELFGRNVDLGTRSIPELERVKIFEVWRNDLVGIEMKKPRLLAGYIIFQTKNGESFRIYIDHKKAFAHIEQLLTLFYPEILNDNPRKTEDSDLAWIDEVQTFDLIGHNRKNTPVKESETRAVDPPDPLPPQPAISPPGRESTDEWASLRLAIEPIPYPIFGTDKNGTIIAWNRAAENLTGVDCTTILGKGDRAYAVPFGAGTRPMLIDFLLDPTIAVQSAILPEISRAGDTLTGNPGRAIIRGKPVLLREQCSGMYDVKRNLIAAIQSTLVSKPQVFGNADENVERYIGGISGVTTNVGGTGTPRTIAGPADPVNGRYGFYVTDRRLFITRNLEPCESTPAITPSGTSMIKEMFGSAVDTRPLTVNELESHKDLEVTGKDIATIEMKKPGTGPGYFIFNTKAGYSFPVYTDNKRAYTHLDTLLKMFYPEITRFE